MLYLLSCLYNEVYITKPHTSRMANSEKYIVCKNFLLDDSSMLYEVFCKEFSKLDTTDEIHGILNTEHDYYFLNKTRILFRNKEYRTKNKQAILDQKKQYRTKNKDLIMEKQRLYQQQNRDKINAYHREYRKKKLLKEQSLLLDK